MSNALDTMLRKDPQTGKTHLHCMDGTTMPASLCLKEKGDRARVESFGLEPLESVWIGFYDKKDLNEQAGLTIILTRGKSGDKFGILVCKSEYNPKRGLWDYNIVEPHHLRNDIRGYTKNPFTRYYFETLKVDNMPTAIGPFDARQTNAFLDVCQAYASIARYEHNAKTIMGVRDPMQLAAAQHDLGAALVRFHSASSKDPLNDPEGFPDITIPRLGPTCPVRRPKVD